MLEPDEGKPSRPVLRRGDGRNSVSLASEDVNPEDGTRFLVERLWPRGIKKASLPMDAWLKNLAPSAALRRWFGHDSAKWEAFRQRYFAELDDKPEALQPLVEAARRGPVTLLYSARATAHNNAVALQQYLEAHLCDPQK